MRRTLENLSRDAELNLCDRCKPVYRSLIEPGVRELIITRFDDWRETESAITQMVMKHRGVFKTDVWVISLGEWNDEYKSDVDRDQFLKIKKWSFQGKIDYLKKHGILPEVCYRLIDLARDRRNNLHEHPLVYRFTDEDLDLFYLCNGVSSNLKLNMAINSHEDIKQITRKN